MDTELIKVVTGLRRSGKSMLLEALQDELLKKGVKSQQVIAINFEDLQYEPYLDYRKLNDYIETKIATQPGEKHYLFLDEIQEVKSFEKVINSLRARHGLDIDIYITGSNAKLLSGELATLIGGRYVQFISYPFLFSEYVEAKRQLGEDISIDELFNKYVVEGGMPFLATNLFEYEQRKNYLSDVYNSIVLKDVISREQIREPELLKRIFSFVLANIGRDFSANSVVKFLRNEGFNTTVATVINYLEYGVNAFALITVPRYSLKDKRHLSNQAKYYVVDQGLRQAIIGKNEENIELVLENIVLIELMARGYEVSVGATKSGYEIDFIAEKKSETGIDRQYFQVSYMMPDEKTRDREFRSLLEVDDAYPKYVLTLDRFFSDTEGVKHVSLIKWLLDK
jgi:predicted AAA+ superfamily ATPase